jgi:exodeoxyribonuclease VII large subunit
MTEKFTLLELQLIIRDSLYLSLPEAYWVMAEISEIKENNAGHCYLELIEKNPGEKNVRARVKAIIWNSRFRFLKAFFENTTGESLREGIKILVKIKVEYHELYGLSLIINDIDPAFTLGEMAIKRQLIIKKLEEEGIFSMNKELRFPTVPQRIAVISSKNAAGYSDFINHLNTNSFGYVFTTTLFETSLQGVETEESVINALDKIAFNAHLFDIVAIIRGGGSQSDLSWFDNYNIAYHVTQFPIPVITGIGHDKDISITDLVANKALKTPTAVADFLIGSLAEAENHILEMSTEIITASRTIIEKNKARIESAGIKLFPLVRIMMSQLRDKLSSQIIDIINIGKEQVIRAGLIPANLKSRLASSARSVPADKRMEIRRNIQRLITAASGTVKLNTARLKSLDEALFHLNPKNILQRGYSITTLNGKIVMQTGQVNLNDIIETHVSDGLMRSKVLDHNKTIDEIPEKINR